MMTVMVWRQWMMAEVPGPLPTPGTSGFWPQLVQVLVAAGVWEVNRQVDLYFSLHVYPALCFFISLEVAEYPC